MMRQSRKLNKIIEGIIELDTGFETSHSAEKLLPFNPYLELLCPINMRAARTPKVLFLFSGILPGHQFAERWTGCLQVQPRFRDTK